MSLVLAIITGLVDRAHRRHRHPDVLSERDVGMRMRPHGNIQVLPAGRRG